MMMEIFTQTASSGQDPLSNIQLPHIPGRFVFSLLKLYLKVNSLNQTQVDGCSEHQLFERFLLLERLVSEMFRLFCWFEDLSGDKAGGTANAMRGVSIFAGTSLSKDHKVTLNKKRGFKTREDFSSDKEYGHYIKAQIKPDMKVRARVNYESVTIGDIGTFRKSNNGTPPAQFFWEGLGETYWVYWHQVVIMASNVKESESDETVVDSHARNASRQPYILKGATSDSGQNSDVVERTAWWEVLCFLKSQSSDTIDRVISLLQSDSNQLKGFDDLVSYTPSYEQAVQVVELLESSHPDLMHFPLTIRESSKFSSLYTSAFDKSKSSPENIDAIIKGMYNQKPPFKDPFDKDKKSLRSLTRNRKDDPAVLLDLKVTLDSQNGTAFNMRMAKESMEKALTECPDHKALIAWEGISAFKNNSIMLRKDQERLGLCTNGVLAFVLKLLSVEPKSFTIQTEGIRCFFTLIGGYSIQPLFQHLDPDEDRIGLIGESISKATRGVIKATLSSLAGLPEDGINTLVAGIQLIVDYFHNDMSKINQKLALSTVCEGLLVLTVVLEDKDAVAKFPELGVSDLLKSLISCFPPFAGKKELLSHVISAMPGSEELHDMLYNSRLNEDESTALKNEVIRVLKLLQKKRTISDRSNPLTRLVTLLNKSVMERAALIDLDPCFVTLFHQHNGVYYLSQSYSMGYRVHSDSFESHALTLLCSLISVGPESADKVVLQGGVLPIVRYLAGNTYQNDLCNICLKALDEVMKNPEYKGVACAASVVYGLSSGLNSKKGFYNGSPLKDTLLFLAKEGEKSPQSETQLHQTVMRLILSELLELFMASIETARRDRESITLPKFSFFINHLSSGSGGMVRVQDPQWWERIEVSNNSADKEKLVDGDSSTYWEVSNSSPPFWIRLHIKKDLVLKKLYLELDENGLGTMPQRVSVSGGTTVDNTRDINTVDIPSSARRYEMLSDSKKHYPVIIIKIKRCHYSGSQIGCRIRGITCEATASTLWPLFGDVFSARSRLYYQIQLHTWLKENLGTLELFDKLFSVIMYEQRFGDSYLHSLQSRQCIGQACRSALVLPLMEAVTKPESCGPDLSQLLHEYMEQVSCPQSCQWEQLALHVSQSVTSQQDPLDMELSNSAAESEEDKTYSDLFKMSRIRRICRLMVDWDETDVEPRPSTTPKKEEEKRGESFHQSVTIDWSYDGLHYGVVRANSNSSQHEEVSASEDSHDNKITISSGTIAMAKCWREIVESHVSKVLQSYATEPPFQVAAHLLSVYDKLKQGLIELFAGHSQFALAMREGFSRSFQTLNEVNGVRFCEVLCQCIDSLMDTGGHDMAALHSLGETERERLLVHFAEPLQFLHGLDIAHVFEHYYKQYLSARVLRGRSVSVLLEQRVSTTLSHCFPNKTPCLMLKDLDISSALMDRFCDTELVESLDQLIVHAAQDNVCPEVIQLYQRCALYRERLFTVYTLNPSSWPVRPHPLPVSTLPPTLAQFCEDYRKFYIAAHESGLQNHEKARRLQFTVDGWAVVAYNGLRLALSTLQMVVLLQFNNTSAHSIQSLHEATQLCYQDICGALLSLSSERQALLTITAPDSSNSCDDELLSALQNTPFKLGSVFKLNSGFAKEALTKHRTKRLRIHDVHLVSSPSGHDNQTADLAHVFERRRAIVDSAIVRILKKDKQMSIENIAHKVIKGCSVGRFDKGTSFGRFDCNYHDICSRVERLIASGYIKRDMPNRQMLVYLPEAGPRGETPEQPSSTVSIDSTSTPEESTVPMKTKTPITVGTVSKPKLYQAPVVSVATSASKSSRKRNGTGRQPQSKTKRKPTALTQIHANEIYEQHEAPLLGMLPTSRSLGPADVQSQVQHVLKSLAPVLNLEEDVLEKLLHHFEWNSDRLIEEYMRDSVAVLKEVGVVGTPTSSPPSRRRTVTCPVCTVSVSSRDLMWLWCNHCCCKSCWQNHLLTQIDLNRALLCSCPVFACTARPTRSFFIKAFGADTDPVNKLTKAVVQSFVESSNCLTWCRNPQGCPQVLCRGDGLDTGACQLCGWTSCFSCTFIESHQPATCEDMQKWVELGGFYVGMDEDAKSKQLANVIAKKCPNCSAQIEKNEGCLHMKCKCQHDFCWKCLKPWKSTHTDYFNCSAKVSKSAKDHKKFQDFNETCTSHHRSKAFTEKLCLIVKSINASVPIKTLSFISDACQLLVQCHKMLIYTSVAEFFITKSDTSGYLSFLSDSLEGDTNVLQALLENTLLSTSADLAKSVSSLSERKLQDGYCLVSKIENTRDKLLIGSQQQFKLGEVSDLGSSSNCDDDSDSNDQSSSPKRGYHPVMLSSDSSEEMDDEGDYFDYSDYSDYHYHHDDDDDYGFGFPFGY